MGEGGAKSPQPGRIVSVAKITVAGCAPNPEQPVVASRYAMLIRRSGWAAVSQFIASGCNFGVGVVLARSLGPAGFGAFAIVFATWVLVLGVARALITHPYVVATSPLVADTACWRNVTRHAAGALIVAGGVAGGLIALVAVMVLDGDLRRAALVLGVLTAPLLLQDFWRFAGFSGNRSRVAAANDTVWAVTLAACLATLVWSDRLTPTTAIAAWGSSGVVAAAFGVAQLRILPSTNLSRAIAWYRSARSMANWFVLSQLVSSLSSQSILILLAWQLGAEATGGLRSIQNLVAPVMLAAMAGEMLALPEASRLTARADRGRGVLRFGFRYAAVLGGVAAAWAVVLVLGGRSLVAVVFGASFVDYGYLIAPVAVTTICGVLAGVAALGLRASRKGACLAMGTVPGSVAKVAAVAVFAPSAGLGAAAWAMAVGGLLQAGALWALFLRSTETPSVGVEQAREVSSARG